MIFTLKVGELTVSPALAQRLWAAFVDTPSAVGRQYTTPAMSSTTCQTLVDY